MRIIGNIEHPQMKITVFKMDNKISIKFETGLLEQTYKFRESEQLAKFEDAKRLVSIEFIEMVLEDFSRMRQNTLKILDDFFPKLEERFEEII